MWFVSECWTLPWILDVWQSRKIATERPENASRPYNLHNTFALNSQHIFKDYLNVPEFQRVFFDFFQNIDISMPNEVRIATINILQAAIRKHLEDISDWSFSISQRWDWKGVGSANLKRDWQCRFGTMRLHVFLSLLSVCIVSWPFCLFIMPICQKLPKFRCYTRS